MRANIQKYAILVCFPSELFVVALTEFMLSVPRNDQFVCVQCVTQYFARCLHERTGLLATDSTPCSIFQVFESDDTHKCLASQEFCPLLPSALSQQENNVFVTFLARTTHWIRAKCKRGKGSCSLNTSVKLLRSLDQCTWCRVNVRDATV